MIDCWFSKFVMLLLLSYYLHQADGEGIRPITYTNQTVKESVLLLSIHQPDGEGVWELLLRLPDGEGDTAKTKICQQRQK